MGATAFLLFALVHAYFANGVPLEKPIALSILGKDLQALEAAYPTVDVWPDKRIIKYSDGLQIVVNFDENKPNSNGKSFLTVVGKVTLAKMKKLPKGLHEMVDMREVRKLFFHGSWFFFDSPDSEPVLNLDNYYVVDYLPLLGRTQVKPSIEYISESELETELLEFLPRIRYESSMSGAKIINTSFRMKNGMKLNVQYDQPNDIAVFKADFRVLVMPDQRNIIKESVKLDKLSFYLYKQSSPELAKLGVVYGVRIGPAPSKPSQIVSDLLKVKRDILLKDIMESTPIQKGTPDTVGMIKYSDGRIFTVQYTQTNQKVFLSLAGGFTANDGTIFGQLCVSFPGGQTDRKGAKWFQNSAMFSQNPVFFSCSRRRSENVQVVLQEDTDYIELYVAQIDATEIAKSHTVVEPYLEYISYEKFLQTMQIVTDALRLKCAKGYPRRSFRLYVDIFVNYDCNSGIAYFDALDLWIGPGRASSFIWENLPGVSYNTNTGHFERETGVFADFKVRQLHPVFPDKLPQDLQYMTSSGETNVAFELRSIEWDLKDTRDILLKNVLPQWGVVRADNFELFVAEKSKENIGGLTVWSLVVKCDVMRPETCSASECAEKDEIIYDGNGIMMRNSRGSKSVPTKVYWPKNRKVPPLNNMFSIGHQIRYIKLPTFKVHMKDLAVMLQKQCVASNRNGGSNAKLSLYMHYFDNKKEPIIGFYDCALHYISFVTEFKIIKFPNINGVSTSYRPGEESKLGPSNAPEGLPLVPYYDDATLNRKVGRTQHIFESEDEQLRRKYSDYVLKDLLFDPVDATLHSKTMFMNEVYALRGLPTNTRSPVQQSRPTKLKVPHGGPEVLVY